MVRSESRVSGPREVSAIRRVLSVVWPCDLRTEPRDPRYVTGFAPTPGNGFHSFARIADELGRLRPDVRARGNVRSL